MEEDYHGPSTLPRPIQERIRKRLEAAVDKAQEQLDFDAAHNSELLYALDIVKGFIQKKKRVCYGGTAMNAILPAAKQFYDPRVDLPDYDFFTPDADADIKDLIHDLKEAGFNEVYHRVGIHKGTMKILVNFVPIADLSSIDPDLYAIFLKRAYVRGGIHYTDPDTLRMMMYLELSRPKGEVARWEKVFERLQLINQIFPPKRTFRVGGGGATLKRGAPKAGAALRPVYRSVLLDFVVEQERSLLSGPLETFYRRAAAAGAGKRKGVAFNLEEHTGPVAFLSSTIEEDARRIQHLLGGPTKVSLFRYRAKGEIVPEHIEIRVRGQRAAIATVFHEVACHSFLRFPTTDGRTICLASPDTLITIYYALVLFTKHIAPRYPSFRRSIPGLISTMEAARRKASETIPAFPVECHGYQKGYATLLREKVKRIAEEKEKASTGTRSAGPKSKRTTRKRKDK